MNSNNPVPKIPCGLDWIDELTDQMRGIKFQAISTIRHEGQQLFPHGWNGCKVDVTWIVLVADLEIQFFAGRQIDLVDDRSVLLDLHISRRTACSTTERPHKLTSQTVRYFQRTQK